MSRHRYSVIFGVVMMVAGGCMAAEESLPAVNNAAEPPVMVDPIAVAVPAPAAFVVPSITADTSIFRRTPVIDGIISDGEWDGFYSFTAQGWDAATYVNWDSKYVYIGVRSSKAVDIMAVFDANCDGWFHGDDNYQFQTSGALSGNMSLLVSRYDSKNTKLPMAVPVSQEEASGIDVKSGRTESSHMIEMKIPATLIQGLRTVGDRKIGMQLNLNAGDAYGGWIPSKESGDTRECTLVTKKIAALKPLQLGFDLRNERVARGDEVVGKFHLTNSGSENIDVRSYVIGGEGLAGEFLSSQKIRTEGLSAKRHVSHEVKSIVPSNMRLGSWAIGAEVRSGGERLGSALISFEVVEPFEIELKLPKAPVKTDVKDVSFAVVVRNNTRGRIQGTATITLPQGWQLWRDAATREFSVGRGDGLGSAVFKAKPPVGVSGDVPVKVAVTVNGRTVEAEGKLSIANE